MFPGMTFSMPDIELRKARQAAQVLHGRLRSKYPGVVKVIAERSNHGRRNAMFTGPCLIVYVKGVSHASLPLTFRGFMVVRKQAVQQVRPWKWGLR